MNIQYITDETGTKKAIVLPIEEYDDPLEDLRDLAVVAERRDAETIGHREALGELKRPRYRLDGGCWSLSKSSARLRDLTDAAGSPDPSIPTGFVSGPTESSTASTRRKLPSR